MRALKVELEAPWAVPVGRAATVAGAVAWGAKAAMVVRRAHLGDFALQLNCGHLLEDGLQASSST